MTKEEHNKLLNDLKNCASDADRMALIVQLEQDYTGVLVERDSAHEKATKAEAECIKYAKLNNDLWLANSAQAQVGQTTPIVKEPDQPTEAPPQKRTFEDLESKFD